MVKVSVEEEKLAKRLRRRYKRDARKYGHIITLTKEKKYLKKGMGR